MAKNIVQTVSASRVGEIATALRNATRGLTETTEAIMAAKAQVDDAKASDGNARETMMLTVATLSADGAWLEGEIDAAAKVAVEGVNSVETKKAIEKFVYDCKTVAHPKVRDAFGDIVGNLATQWDAETAARAKDKSAPAPVRERWSRRYHAIIDCAKAMRDGKLASSTVADIVKFALATQSVMQPKDALKKIAKLITELTAIQTDFPAADLGLGIETLQNINERMLTVAFLSKQETHESEVKAPAKPATVSVPNPGLIVKKAPVVAEMTVESLLEDAMA